MSKSPLSWLFHSNVEETLGPRQRTLALFLISVMGLYLELMLIRWITTEIRIFAYLQNTVLVVCFLGIGMGCWTCRQPIRLGDSLYPLTILVGLLTFETSRGWLSELTQIFSMMQDMVIWDTQHTHVGTAQFVFVLIVALMLTLALMLLVWEIFVPMGRLLGRCLDDHPRPIWAYSVNIAGSLLGILAFVLMSAWYMPPMMWLAGLAVLYLFFIHFREWQHVLLLLVLILLGYVSDLYPSARVDRDEDLIKHSRALIWSPYQKLNLREGVIEVNHKKHPLLKLLVNDAPYMVLKDLRPEEVNSNDVLYPSKMRGYTQYDLPCLLHPEPKKMLIVGSGGGNDVAGGLRHNAAEIVAVEIDPAIIEIGKAFHPEQPYQSPRVRVVNDDARAFFVNTKEKFDLIVFGLLDSHTTTSMTNARLDHYVYTRESITHAKSLLTEGGTIVLSFEATKPFIADRMASVLREVFGQEPIAFRVPVTPYGYGGVMFIVGNLDLARQQIESLPGLKPLIEEWQREYPLNLTGTTRICTDDWPYIYLESPRIPSLYWLLIVMLIMLFGLSVRRLKAAHMFTQWKLSHWHFFFMGAAFMLLEVQNISKAAVVLGNTWDVNAVIISSILILILVANWLVSLWPRMPILPVYIALLGTCLGLYFVDLSWLAGYPYYLRAMLVGLLTSLPMLFSGMVFIRSFAFTQGKDAALGANLLGALVGGLLQALTYVTGIKALLLMVAGLYGLALMTRPRSQPLAAPPSTPAAHPAS